MFYWKVDQLQSCYQINELRSQRKLYKNILAEDFSDN